MINELSIDETMEAYPMVAIFLENMSAEYWKFCKLQILKRGETFFHRGDFVQYIYILCQGIVVISNEDVSGSEMRVVFVTEGNMVGEMETLARGNTLVYSARAYTNCVVIRIPADTFLRWIASESKISKILLGILAQKLHDAANEASEYTHFHAIVKLATLISSEKPGIINKTRRELAEMCSVNVRTIGRCIGKLKQEKLVDTYKGKIRITSEQKGLISLSEYHIENMSFPSA